jgi:hypothetical protein
MGRRTLVCTFIIGALFALQVGCDNDPEQNRSVVTVASINGNAPLLSDVWEQGAKILDEDTVYTADDHIREDWVPVVFYNRPYNSVIAASPGSPHGDFLVTHYRIHWVRTDGGVQTLPDHEAGLSILVPSDEFVEGLIQVVTFENKVTQFIHDLCYWPPLNCNNSNDEIFMRAEITFYGHELGTDRETEIETQLGVSFADLVVETEED